MRLFGFSLAAIGVLLTGCISMPAPAYRKVDQETPAFKEAVTREAARQQERGKSPAQAQEIATQKVIRQIIKMEQDRRLEQVTPLLTALTALDRPRGCWAYTLTTATCLPDKTTVVVERYDAFQPEERLWTLVMRDGQAPDEKTQANYRRAKVNAWKKQLKQSPPKYSQTESLNLQAVWGEMEVTPSDPSGTITFTFVRGHAHVAMIGDIPRWRETYATDIANHTMLRHAQILLEPAVMLSGSIKLETWDSSTDYIVLDPALPPFIAKTKSHYRGRFFGRDTGEVEIETVFSDYRRVKCYDKRFEVKIGEPSMTDLLPGKD